VKVGVTLVSRPSIESATARGVHNAFLATDLLLPRQILDAEEPIQSNMRFMSRLANAAAVIVALIAGCSSLPSKLLSGLFADHACFAVDLL
jgi:hypothetical protein